jgi:glucokinase
MSGHRCAIGVDLGGQSVKLGVVDEQGVLSLHRQVAIDATASAPRVADLIIEQIHLLQDAARDQQFDPRAVGVVMPGYMDRDRTRLLMVANLPNLSGSDLLERVRGGVDLPVSFDADCNAAALGEYRFGAGKGSSPLIVAVVGTGIGAGVIVEGRVLRVREHIAGSLGHVVVDAGGPVCACGAKGCVEAHASGRALEARATVLAGEHPESLLAGALAERGRLTGLDIRTALERDDAAAEKAVAECGWWLGAGVASWSVIYAPQRVLIGGGVAGLGAPYLAAIRRGFEEVGQPGLVRSVEIDLAALGPHAGVIGAAALVMPAASP